MSTLKRYRKPGGFKQLLVLIETSATPKRDQLMKIVASEDKSWFDELSRRMLTAEKIFSWEPEAIERVLQLIPDQTWPKALFHLPQADRDKLFQALIKFQPQHKQKQLLEYIAELKPAPGEIDAAQTFIIKKVRELQIAGDFRPEKFDPSLSLDGLDRLMI